MRVSRTISVVICGMSNSGKTALTARLRDKEFVEAYVPTLHTDTLDHYIRDKCSSDAFIKLHTHDFSGDKSFESTTSIFYSGRSALYFVVDPTVPLDAQFKTFESILNNLKNFEETKLVTSPEPLLFLVQTKADLLTEANKLEVVEQLQEFIKLQAKQQRIFSLYVTSSKTHNDQGIKKLLETTLYGQSTVLTNNYSATLFKETFINIRVDKTPPTLDQKPVGPGYF